MDDEMQTMLEKTLAEDSEQQMNFNFQGMGYLTENVN
jgi:hypothetical protein